MTGKFQQLHEFRLVMLESVFRWILRGLNADGTENHVINTNITHVLRVFATDRYNYENDAYKFYHLRPAQMLPTFHPTSKIFDVR